MNRWLYNLQVGARRAVLFFILLVPEPVRAALRRNPLLTAIYEYFDRSKYENTYDAGHWERRSRAMSRHTAYLNHDDYAYCPPTLTDEVRETIDAGDGPLFSILLPVHNTPPEWLQAAVDSVLAQWYPDWELCLVDDCSDRDDTRAFLATLDDPRIKRRRLPENRHIVGASNAALALATGEWVALLDHDDTLTPDALYRVWRTIERENPDFVYSDEDKIDEEGRYCAPHFKPDFAPDHLLSQNYLCHLAVIRRELVEAVGGFAPGVEGAQDHDLFLRVLERTDRVAHIPRVLYHWRRVPGSTAAEFGEKSYAQAAGEKAVQNALDRRGLRAAVSSGRYPGTYRVRYAIAGEPLVSIVIPFKDRPELLATCIDSILERTTWEHFEVIGVSNNSEEETTFDCMRALATRDRRVRFVTWDEPFNFSAINNFAVREHARGEHVLLCNNDIEFITPDWIESLLEFSQREDVGVVGAKLYYPDGRVQHAGVTLGIRGAAGHAHKRFQRDDPGYKSRPHIIHNVSAVTAALFMVKKTIYDDLGGLEEDNLCIAFNDIDFCLRVRDAGYLNVFTPYCEAWHHESVSRGYEDTDEKRDRFWGEVQFFRARHEAALAAGDPYYNPNLSLEFEDFRLADAVRVRPEEGNA